MEISKYIDPKLIKLEMTSRFEVDEDEGEEVTERQRFARKEEILSECVDLLELSGNVCNRNKLLIDLINREKKATTALGKGIAVPHVRTMQARDLIIGVCRSSEGYDFDALDQEPVHIFIPMAAPPYDDNLYLRVFKELAEMLQYAGFIEKVMSAQAPYEVILAIKELE